MSGVNDKRNKLESDAKRNRFYDAGAQQQMDPGAPPCAWCGLRKSAGKYEGTECCQECRNGGRVERVRQSMERWKRGAK